jgi:tRNA pseudouridine-54 N-methylase
MMGMGSGMMGMTQGSATMDEHRDIQDLVFSHDRIKRTVTNLLNGFRTVTESDDPRIAALIKKHVSEMGRRVDAGRDPGLPVESPALHTTFREKDKIKGAYQMTDKGSIVVQTSTDANTVKALQDHAAEVTNLARLGMVAMHEAMLRNGGGMMGHDKHGAMAEQ